MDYYVRVDRRRGSKRSKSNTAKMKLKDLMVSTLPRSRKSKRKTDAPCNRTKENVAWSGSHASTIGNPHSDSSHATSKPAASRNAFSINFNFNIPGKKCVCRKSSPDTVKPVEQDLWYYSEADGCHGASCTDGGSELETNYNTIPKARSRIRTNPWFPSHRTSPQMTPPSTPITSPSSSMTSSLTYSLPGQATPSSPESGIIDTSFSSSSDFCSMDSYELSRASDRIQSDYRTGKELADSLSDVDSLLQGSFTPDMMCGDRSVTSDARFYTQAMPVDEDSPNDVVIRIKQSPNKLVSTISFEYEEELESRLESREFCGDELGSRDRTSWSAFETKDLSTFSRGIGNTFQMDHSTTVVDEEDDCFLDDNKPLFSDDSEDSGSTICNDVEAMSEDALACNERPRSYSSSRIHADTKCILTSGRSVDEIQSSLHQKVLKLREEKRLVDEKIRQAREEERVRNQEIERFRKQVVLHRKQVLLDTLKGLREKLANQSERLQTSYDDVLSQQRHEAVIRSRHGSGSSEKDADPAMISS